MARNIRSVTSEDLKCLANLPYFGAGHALDAMGHRAEAQPGESDTYTVKVSWSASYECEIEIEAASEGEARRLAREEVEDGQHIGIEAHIEIHDAKIVA